MPALISHLRQRSFCELSDSKCHAQGGASCSRHDQRMQIWTGLNGPTADSACVIGPHIASAACRYQLDWAGPQFGAFTPQQHINYAKTTQVQRMAGYLAKGGLPPIVGEWALAGMQMSA